MPIIAGIMLPHPPLAISEVGGGEEEKIKNTLDGFEEAAKKIAELRPDTIILTSPHAVMYHDYFHISPGRGARGDMGSFRAPQVSFSVDYDEDLVQKICRRADRLGIPAGTSGERDRKLDHGTMVPLYFVNKYYTDYQLVRIGLSGFSLEVHYNFGRLIKSVADETDKRIVFLASGDLSHCQKEDGPYGYKKEGPEYDKRLMEVMGKGDFSKLLTFDENFLEKAEECGHRSFVIMAGAFDGLKVEPRIMSHEATFGVGYGTGIFMPKEDEMKKESTDPLVKLAVETINSYVKDRKRPDKSSYPEEALKVRAGAFVSVHECGMLRGCIGTIGPTMDNLAQEIVQNAISAVSKDPRFEPVTEDELSSLEINVDVLKEPEPISSMKELDVKKYGVIVESGYKRGLLLPDLEGVDSVEEQVLIARRKGGIGDSEKYSLYRFEVERHV